MARSNDFALTYFAAHEEAGMTRISLVPILHRIAEDPNYLFAEELQRLAGQSPAHADTRKEDYEKVAINTLLAFLYNDLRDHITNRMPLDANGHLLLCNPPDSPHGLDVADTAGLEAAPAETLIGFLRDSVCHLLDAIIKDWAIKVTLEEERCRAEGAITPLAAAGFVLANTLEASVLHAPSGYDMLSITKTGSHTALHVCWNLCESAPMLKPGLTPAEYDDLSRRSLKQVLPLAMGSLGMLCQFMGAGHIEADDHQAIHPLPRHQTAFVYDAEAPGGMIVLNADLIEPTAQLGERHYTGCPAFYANGLINLYMEIVLSLAARYDIYGRVLRAG
ncbi:hypothetical protein D9623_21930 [Azospirillum brasilense]|uniref:Uncharacterized protein n=1 Tax=Azospirillum brasilense TaxID=192 RepID=A0A0P0F2B6_AZOBR|nr:MULTISPECIES: hypothetical protein [Azospirillum]ALJ37365.1 hypothetical protein AMK58_18010 [Azospirillum brasilense]MDW7552101.1 hypothetical protein [Azospirillum brasilense]MDW7591536.1 hypothetical protein [Azospirillum brasilense]MDW7626706.1 hypothetical protein [Azospirillum brasilense]MDX5950945.1 hypothetical protein [Azospirillum brasilense]